MLIKNPYCVPVIEQLRAKYPGQWVYMGMGHYEHVGKGFACYMAILGGMNGDDIVGRQLWYYPKDGQSEMVDLLNPILKI